MNPIEKWNTMDYSYLRPPQQVFDIEHPGGFSAEY